MSNIEQIKEILKIKKDIYQSIVKKGSDINKTAPFENYAQKISEIKTTSGKVDLGDLKITKFSPKPNDSEMTFTDNDGNELLNFGNMVITNQNEQINYTAKHVGMQDLSGSTIADTNKEIQILLQRLGQGVKKIKLCGQYGTYLIMDNGDLYAAGHSRLLGNPSSTNAVTEFTKVAENVRDACLGMSYSGTYLMPMYVTENDELFISSKQYYSKTGDFEKIADYVKTIYEGYVNAFYITNDDTLFGIGSDSDRLLSNNGQEATTFIELATNVKDIYQFADWATYYITNDHKLYCTGPYSDFSAKYSPKSYSFKLMSGSMKILSIVYKHYSSTVYHLDVLYEANNKINIKEYYYSSNSPGSHSYSIYTDSSKKEIAKNIKNILSLTDSLYSGGLVLLDDGSLCHLSYINTYSYYPSNVLIAKVKKLQHIFDVSSGGQNNKYALLALTENGELYKYSNNTSNNVVGNSAETGLVLINSNVADFTLNYVHGMTMYNSGYVTTKGDAYLVGYNKLGNLGVGNTTDVINSYTKVSLAENNV